MTYVKQWENSEKLNKTEIKKLEKEGLQILDDIPSYAVNEFESIPEDQWDLFKCKRNNFKREKKTRT